MICDLLLPLKRMFRDSQIVIITNFVVVSSVGIKRVDCTYILPRNHAACMVVYPIMVDNFASILNCTTVLRLNNGFNLHLFQMIGASLSMSVFGIIVVLFVVFLCFCFRSPLSTLLYFISVLDYMCFTAMFHRWARGTLFGPNIYL